MFRAWTTPELITRWWAAGHGEVSLAEVDLRVGGAWRYVMVANGGVEVAFHGEYLEVVRDELVVFTEVFEGAPDAAPAVCTYTFSQIGGDLTTLTLLTELATKEDRDAVIDSGMESGMQAGWDIAEEIAVSLRSARGGHGLVTARRRRGGRPRS